MTRCTRPQNLYLIEDTLFNNKPTELDIRWHIIFDTSYFYSIPSEILQYFGDWHNLYFKDNNGYGMSVFNDIIPESFESEQDWFYILDDDNIVHHNFYKEVYPFLKENNFDLIFFDQYIGGKDWTGKEKRVVRSDNIKIGEVDSAQFLFRFSLWNNSDKFGPGYVADGKFIESVYKEHSDNWVIINKTICYYNYFNNGDESKKSVLPSVLVISPDKDIDNIYSKKHFDFEENRLNPQVYKNDQNISDKIYNTKPDSIISVGDSWDDFLNLSSLSHDIRSGWYHLPKDSTKEEIGEVGYEIAMYNIIRDRGRDLISVFTPVYNTGELLYQTYESLRNQTYDNWEWVIVNDSTDERKTGNVIKNICKKDPRVKEYKLDKQSGGNIGFVKYFACSMTSGELLVELDHDDYLLPNCLHKLKHTMETHPECGFFYSDCIQLFRDTETPLIYPDGWAWGYGYYYDYEHNGKKIKVGSTPNINPKTIRHIVSSPNHVRSWRRNLYFNIGGHNKHLPIADDYELVVRSFLNTKMCKINSPLYVQYYQKESGYINTTDYRRADIQRRVDYIHKYYNSSILNRFNQLGVEDWAYQENPLNPLLSKSKFKDSEGYVNIIVN